MIFDTGALIGFERGKHNVAALVAVALATRTPIVVPSVVIAEAWRGGRRSARMATLLAGCRIEPLHEGVARKAGEAMVAIQRATTIDAIVVAHAHALKLPIVTSDASDMRALATHFGGVHIVDV
jgi:predicted nucleic acid-binding protein